jgi:hypothetical protein
LESDWSSRMLFVACLVIVLPVMRNTPCANA